MHDAAPSPLIFVLGHPLVDMQVTDGEALLEKYALLANDGIRAEDKHMSIYDEIVRDYQVTYVAGGTANAARAAAYILPLNTVVYTGCTGDDALKEQLSAANAREGVLEFYDVRKDVSTGACAVIITGHQRSMVTSLRAAECFDRAWLDTPKLVQLIDKAKVFYMEGYWLTHGLECLVALAERSAAADKTFALNISAPFVPQLFKPDLDQSLRLADIVFCNEAEARAWAVAEGVPANDIPAIASVLAVYPKANSARSRLVIVTQGAQSTIVASPDWKAPKTFPVDPIEDSRIADTNGAGDAFVGGFLAAYVLGKPLDTCIQTGHKMGAMNVQLVGPTFKWPKVHIMVD